MFCITALQMISRFTFTSLNLISPSPVRTWTHIFRTYRCLLINSSKTQVSPIYLTEEYMVFDNFSGSLESTLHIITNQFSVLCVTSVNLILSVTASVKKGKLWNLILRLLMKILIFFCSIYWPEVIPFFIFPWQHPFVFNSQLHSMNDVLLKIEQ